LVFVNEMKSVYSAVRTAALNKAVCASYLKGQTAGVQTAIFSCRLSGHLLSKNVSLLSFFKIFYLNLFIVPSVLLVSFCKYLFQLDKGIIL